MVDRFVLRVCNLRQITQKHFTKDDKLGVRLTKVGLKRFFQSWEKYLDEPMAGIEENLSIENVIRQQIDSLASHIREIEKYEPVMIGNKSKCDM